jgi:hypothetical protein
LRLHLGHPCPEARLGPHEQWCEPVRATHSRQEHARETCGRKMSGVIRPQSTGATFYTSRAKGWWCQHDSVRPSLPRIASPTTVVEDQTSSACGEALHVRVLQGHCRGAIHACRPRILLQAQSYRSQVLPD